MEQLMKIEDMSTVAITPDTVSLTPGMKIVIKLLTTETLKEVHAFSQGKGLREIFGIKPDTA
ncbi:hypothetical protein MBAV_006345 [Candidatus Magnetobacterium bavaricum]|uniref:Uncharacterized protein n=1 Tax=Candidatus Magnetobacterium bavaricum TaxID=29290 RepID=A0A0F3GI08_9BACT|nr:hypothetical protein MBAV_006345 [Candidatus Magnetobacterium bavaricum]